MDYYVFVGQVNLAFQIAILVVLLAGFMFKRRGDFFLHGTAMFVSVILNAVSFFVVMGPSLIGRVQFVEINPLGRLSSVILAHAIVGGAAEVLGLWIVASWHLQSSTQKCVMKKKIMLVTMILWIIAILLGFLLYAFIANLIG